LLFAQGYFIGSAGLFFNVSIAVVIFRKKSWSTAVANIAGNTALTGVIIRVSGIPGAGYVGLVAIIFITHIRAW
jgi:hypothetical protein